MSSTSTSRNTSRTRKRVRTRYTMWLHFQNTSGAIGCPVSLPAPVATLLADGRLPVDGEIWKYCAPPSDTGAGNGEESRLMWFSLQNRAPVTDGSQEEKRPASFAELGAMHISHVLSSLDSTPAPDPETSLDCNGRK
jgi:hypothetical protein